MLCRETGGFLENDKIIWNCSGDSHLDTIEMAGNQIAAIVTYGVMIPGRFFASGSCGIRCSAHCQKILTQPWGAITSKYSLLA